MKNRSFLLRVLVVMNYLILHNKNHLTCVSQHKALLLLEKLRDMFLFVLLVSSIEGVIT